MVSVKINEPDDVAGVLEVAGQVHHRVVVNPFLDHGIDLDGSQPNSIGGIDALQHPVDADSPAVHLFEDFIVQSIQTDRNSL